MKNMKIRRIGAFLLDAFIINAFIRALLQMLLSVFVIVINTNDFVTLFILILSQSIIAVLYTLLCQKLYNGTLGKRLLGLKVVTSDNHKELSIPKLISREWSKWIIFYYFAGVSILINILMFIISGTSIHDKLNKTEVEPL